MSRIKLTILLNLFFLLVSATASAQIGGQGATPAPLAKGRPLGSYQISDIENINYFSGHLSINISTGGGQGRGEGAYPVIVSLNSPSWSAYTDMVPDNTGNGGFEPAAFAEYEMPGKITGSYANSSFGMSARKRMQIGYADTSYCAPGGGTFYQNSLTRIYVTMPDGTEHELRDTATDGQQLSMVYCGYYRNRGRTFVSKDGANLKFIASSDVYDDAEPGAVSGYLYMPDGRVFAMGETLGAARDRNGNLTTFENPTLYPFPPNRITDSIGRQTTIEGYYYDSNSPETALIKYKGTGGADRQISVVGGYLGDNLASGETIPSLNQLFSSFYSISNFGAYSYVISEIALPNGQSYKFKYNGYGEVARMEMPTGAVVEYSWATGKDGAHASGQINPGNVSNTYIYRRVIERRLYADGTNLTSTITISRPETTSSDAGYVDVKTYTPSTSNLSQFERHYYYGKASDTFITASFGYIHRPWALGKEYKTEIFDPQNSALLRRTAMQWSQTSPSWWNSSCGLCSGGNPDYAPENNPQITEITTTLENNQVSKQTFAYDSYNNRTDVYDYDYGSGAAGSFLRRTHTDFLTTNSANSNIDYTSGSNYLLNLPSQTWVSSDSAGNNKVSLTTYEYDNYSTDSNHAGLTSRSNVVGFDATNFASATVRGNLTAVTTYTNAAAPSGAISVYSQYDILGNVVKAIDGKGYVSTIDYSDRFGAPNAEARNNTTISGLNGNSTFAFATSVTNPLSYTSYAQFDYYLGSPVDSEDLNGNVDSTFYVDSLDRPTQVIKANNRSALKSQTTIAYDDTNRKMTTTSDLFTYNDNLVKKEVFSDKMGRPYKTYTYKDGTYIINEQTYDKLGRLESVSSPYFNSASIGSMTVKTYDPLGRVIKMATSGNSVTTEVNTSYSGNTVTVADQAGKLRRSVSNALGQLTRIDEPNGSNQLDVSGSPVQSTHYYYNTIGKMIRVNQGSQNRYFMYDSLGRITRVRQPEQQTNSNLNTSGNPDNNSWTAGITYDNNGNAATTTDAKNVVITNSYDYLNRLTQKSYSDSTPQVNYTYDDSGISNSKGHLTKVSSSISETRYTSFSEIGQILSSEQRTTAEQRSGSQTPYQFSYAYDLSGAMVEETYPSGRKIKNVLDSDGDLSMILSKKNSSSGYAQYANSLSYTASRRISQIQLGNGRWEHAVMNGRDQVTEIAMGVTTADSSLWKVNYEYGELQSNGTVDATKNTGDIAKHTTSFTGQTNPYVQWYKYDTLSRITEAKETVNGTQKWIQNFGYDRYGNRTSLDQYIGSTHTTQSPSFDASTNRFSSGYTYDAAGNVTVDPDGMQFTFNGDNKQVEVKNNSNVTVGKYTYDGNGKRVTKETTSEFTIFVYDASGNLAGEYSTQLSSAPAVSYTATDQLGSPRALTDENGNVVSRRDFMPFGEELNAGVGDRTTTLKYGYGSDNVRQRFTGYQRDLETGLDFAEARYYDNKKGRFTAVDPLLASGKSADPQTFNRYVYVMNRPLVLTDSTGLQAGQQPAPVSPADRRVNQAAVDQANAAAGTFTEQQARRFEEAKTNALRMVAPAPEGQVNQCRAALIRHFGGSDPTAVIQGLTATGGAAVLNEVTGLPDVGPQNVFNGMTSTFQLSNGQSPETYFNDNPQTSAIHDTDTGFIYLDDSFFSGRGDLGRAQDILHESVAHKGNGRRDSEFAPAGAQNPQAAGSLAINDIIRANCNTIPPPPPPPTPIRVGNNIQNAVSRTP